MRQMTTAGIVVRTHSTRNLCFQEKRSRKWSLKFGKHFLWRHHVVNSVEGTNHLDKTQLCTTAPMPTKIRRWSLKNQLPRRLSKTKRVVLSYIGPSNSSRASAKDTLSSIFLILTVRFKHSSKLHQMPVCRMIFLMWKLYIEDRSCKNRLGMWHSIELKSCPKHRSARLFR